MGSPAFARYQVMENPADCLRSICPSCLITSPCHRRGRGRADTKIGLGVLPLTTKKKALNHTSNKVPRQASICNFYMFKMSEHFRENHDVQKNSTMLFLRKVLLQLQSICLQQQKAIFH
jgi:hypothetical protein